MNRISLVAVYLKEFTEMSVPLPSLTALPAPLFPGVHLMSRIGHSILIGESGPYHLGITPSASTLAYASDNFWLYVAAYHGIIRNIFLPYRVASRFSRFVVTDYPENS